MIDGLGGEKSNMNGGFMLFFQALGVAKKKREIMEHMATQNTDGGGEEAVLQLCFRTLRLS